MAFAYILIKLVNLYSWIIFIYILMSWIPTKQGTLAEIERILGKICDPYLDLFKKLIPPIGGMVDVTPIIALLVLQFAVRLIVMIF